MSTVFEPNNENPFAAPGTEPQRRPRPQRQDFEDEEVRVEGELLVGRSPIWLPDYCVRCGVDADAEAKTGRRVRRKIVWNPPWVILFLFLTLPVLVIMYFLTRRTLNIDFALCTACNQRKRKLAWMRGLTWLATLALFVMAAAMENGWLGFLALMVLMAALAMLVAIRGPIQVKSCKEGFFHIGGSGDVFRERLSRGEGLEDTEWEDR